MREKKEFLEQAVWGWGVAEEREMSSLDSPGAVGIYWGLGEDGWAGGWGSSARSGSPRRVRSPEGRRAGLRPGGRGRVTEGGGPDVGHGV